MFISQAHAQAAGAGQGDFIMSMLPLVLIFVVFYFLLIRPQQRKMKAHRDLIAAVKRGDKILTAGGIVGTVVKIEDAEDTVLVEIAKEVRVKILRSTITDLINDKMPLGKPANDTVAGAARPGLMSQLFGKK